MASGHDTQLSPDYGRMTKQTYVLSQKQDDILDAFYEESDPPL